MIFFDAAGTLFDVRGSVGEIYSRFARRHGVEAESAIVHQSFLRAFRRQPPLAFPVGTPAEQLRKLEYQWWWNLVREVFVEYDFPRFGAFFAEVFEFFRGRDAWYVFDDVVPALEALKARGPRLAVLSNFDSRLEDLIRAFGLNRYFDAIHYSTRMGAAKPDPAIFRAALRAHGIEAHQAMHVGDSLRADVGGATAAGIPAVLVDRNQQHGNPPGVWTITRLADLRFPQ
jgi:putative hydrolase of the HAD superfamily